MRSEPATHFPPARNLEIPDRASAYPWIVTPPKAGRCLILAGNALYNRPAGPREHIAGYGEPKKRSLRPEGEPPPNGKHGPNRGLTDEQYNGCVRLTLHSEMTKNEIADDLGISRNQVMAVERRLKRYGFRR